MTAVRILLLAIASACCLAGCSSGSGGSTPAASTPAATARSAPASSPVAPTTSVPPAAGGCDVGALTPLCDTIDFTGAVRIHGSTAETAFGASGPAKSCAEVVAGRTNAAGNTYFAVPRGSAEKVGGHAVLVDAEVKAGHYHGAGSYGPLDIDTSGGLLIDDVSYGSGPSTTATVTVRSDGGGSLVFSDVVSADGKSVSGSMSWTCEL
jgi:hypothetical protein